MQIIALILLIAGIGLSLVAFFTVLGFFFPGRIARTRTMAESMMRRSFLVGLVNFAFFIAIALALIALGDSLHSDIPNVIGLILLIPLGVGLVFGLAGMVQFVGEKLKPQASELARTAWGTVGLGLACGLPFVGWFGLLPFVGCLGLGALIISLFNRERPVVPLEAS
jgi:hypothetical protein